MRGELSIAEQQKVALEFESQEMVDFLSGIIPAFVKDGVGILNDQVKSWRWHKQVDLLVRAKAKIVSSGLPTKAVDPKILLPLMEKASLETDESLQEKWENLLANSAAGNIEVQPKFVDVLNDISPIEAKVLDFAYDEYLKWEGRPPILLSDVREKLSLDKEKAEIFFENLQRLNLVRPERQDRSFRLLRGSVPTSRDFFVSGTSFGSNSRPVSTDAMEKLLESVNEIKQKLDDMNEEAENYEFTAFGRSFMRACKWNPTNP